MIERYARIVAWSALALIIVVTVSPLAWRPDFGHVNIERFAAFMLAGFLFSLAYPRHFFLVTALVLGAAILLEAAQLLIPGRDGTLSNLVIKILGGSLGLGRAYVINKVILNRRRPPE